MYGGISDPGMGPYRPRVALTLFPSSSQSTIGRWGWGFYTVRDGIDKGGHCFRPRVVAVVEIRKDFRTGDEVFSRGATPAARAAARRWPRESGEGALDQWASDSENAWMKAISNFSTIFFVVLPTVCIRELFLGFILLFVQNHS